MTITTEQQNECAIREMNRLMDLEPKPGSPEGDRLRELADAVGEFEKRYLPL